MAANFRGKIYELGLPTFICCIGIPKRIRMSLDSNDDLPAVYRNLVRFNPVALQFTKLEYVQHASG